MWPECQYRLTCLVALPSEHSSGTKPTRVCVSLSAAPTRRSSGSATRSSRFDTSSGTSTAGPSSRPSSFSVSPPSLPSSSTVPPASWSRRCSVLEWIWPLGDPGVTLTLVLFPIARVRGFCEVLKRTGRRENCQMFECIFKIYYSDDVCHP